MPPFAEEMNKCRRMLALQAQALAAAGIVAVHPDLYGTGDSEGEFSDARWGDWRANVADTVRWARTHVGDCIDFLAVRAGALLALDALRDIYPPPRRAVLWSPTVSGRTFMTQFFRVQIAAGLSIPTSERQGTAGLWKQLESGLAVEIGGYRISSNVALAVRDSNLESLVNSAPTSITWFEVLAANSTVGPAAQRALDVAKLAGRSVDARSVRGEPFWATPEIAIAPDLIADTTATFLRLDGRLGH